MTSLSSSFLICSVDPIHSVYQVRLDLWLKSDNERGGLKGEEQENVKWWLGVVFRGVPAPGVHLGPLGKVLHKP